MASRISYQKPSEKAAEDAREYASACAFVAMSCALASVRAWIDGDEHAARAHQHPRSPFPHLPRRPPLV